MRRPAQHWIPHSQNFPNSALRSSPQQEPNSALRSSLLQVSSKSNLNVPAAVAAIRRERKGRDVFVMGAANVGKSAFIRALVR